MPTIVPVRGVLAEVRGKRLAWRSCRVERDETDEKDKGEGESI